MTTTSPVDFGNSLSQINAASSTQSEAATKLKAKSRQTAENFEAMFLNNTFQEMFTNIDGDGPFGGSGALKVWRSFMTDQYAKTFAKAGGIGVADKVYDTLLRQQGLTA